MEVSDRRRTLAWFRRPWWSSGIIRMVMVVVVTSGALACSDSAPVLSPAPEPSPTAPVPTATPEPQPRSYNVGNTAGVGVFIRRTPDLADRIRAWADGTVMTEIGPGTTVAGTTWRNLEDPEGNRGWVPSQYLELTAGSRPPAEAPTAAATGVSSGPGGRWKVKGTGDCLNIRAQPGLAAPILACIKEGSSLEDTGETRPAGGITWLSVTTESGVKGWASKDYLVR